MIREASDDERTPTDTEIAADLSRIEEGQKGKAAVPKLKRWKSVVVTRSQPGVTVSSASPCQSGDLFTGLDDIPIPDYVSLHHGSGLEELRGALDISESLPVSVIDASGWSGGLRIYSLFTTLHDFHTHCSVFSWYLIELFLFYRCHVESSFYT